MVRVGDGEGILAVVARPDGLGRMPGLPPRAIHPVPTDDGRFVQAVDQGGLKSLAFAKHEDGVQVVHAVVRNPVDQHGRTRGQKRAGASMFGYKMNLLVKPIRVAQKIKTQPDQVILTCRFQRCLYYSESNEHV